MGRPAWEPSCNPAPRLGPAFFPSTLGFNLSKVPVGSVTPYGVSPFPLGFEKVAFPFPPLSAVGSLGIHGGGIEVLSPSL